CSSGASVSLLLHGRALNGPGDAEVVAAGTGVVTAGTGGGMVGGGPRWGWGGRVWWGPGWWGPGWWGPGWYGYPYGYGYYPYPYASTVVVPQAPPVSIEQPPRGGHT